MTEIERLNTWLESFGKSLEGKFYYRLIWSDKVFEHRYGTYNDFSESGLFLRQVTETREVRKYSYIHERWILEKWAPGNLTANKETPNTLNGDYIPVYVFEDSKGNYLPPTEKSLKFILDFMSGTVKKDEEVPQELIDEKEVKLQMEMFEDTPMFRTFGPTRNSVGYTRELRGK